MISSMLIVLGVIAVVILFGLIFWVASLYKKTIQGKVLVRTGAGGTKVAFNGMFVLPVIHKMEIMDISIKKVEIARRGTEGLICKDNMRADIEVAFFVRVNKSDQDIKNVAQTIGCERASDLDTLKLLFEAKFSEALKSVGKKFDFTELYEARREFRDEIINIIGTDLNGYVLDDCAIDYLEQTSLEFMKQDNILDAEGIKKIAQVTAQEKIKANLIRRDEEKTIRKQDVEAREAILELDKQLAEKEEKQKREIANIKSREDAEIMKVAEEERLRSESVKIQTDEELQVAAENRDRQVIVARKNKERTEAVESERVEKDRLLEVTERERIVTLADIEKEKVIEVEKRNIQDVIKERVMVEKTVVVEEEGIKDLRAFKEVDRNKQVTVTNAEAKAQEQLVMRVKEAEAEKDAAELKAKQLVIEADAQKEASAKEGEARKIIADAHAKEQATLGLSEAQVMEAKAEAREREGIAEALVIEKTALAEAKGIEAKAQAMKTQGYIDAEVINQKGTAEADVIAKKAFADAEGLTQKADAMKKLDGVGKEHEEFKLRLNKDKEIELATISIQKDIADAQANVIGEALKSAKIDIVGGETMFFDKIIGSITSGKQVDKVIGNSQVLSDFKDVMLNGDGDLDFKGNLKSLVDKFGITSEDIKNLSIAALIMRLNSMAKDSEDKGLLGQLMDFAKQAGLADKKANSVGL